MEATTTWHDGIQSIVLQLIKHFGENIWLRVEVNQNNILFTSIDGSSLHLTSLPYNTAMVALNIKNIFLELYDSICIGFIKAETINRCSIDIDLNDLSCTKIIAIKNMLSSIVTTH